MSGLTTGLVRRDLLDLEQRLRDSLHRVLPFEAHAVYFPRQTRSQEPEWLPDEGKLLLPLVRHGELLGVFMARVPDAERVTALLPSLPGIVDLCLENLELYKAGRLDPRSGLATHEVLLERLTQETGAIQSAFAREFGLESGEGSSRGGTLGLIVVRFDGVREVARNISYGFADRLVGWWRRFPASSPSRRSARASATARLRCSFPKPRAPSAKTFPPPSCGRWSRYACPIR